MLRALDKLVNIDSSMILLLLLHLMLLLIFALDVETRARFARAGVKVRHQSPALR
jgi:hypothetical protein